MCILCALYDFIQFDMNNEKYKFNWEKPEIIEQGNAKEVVKNVNVTGGGDSQFSVLLPS